jgi:hypothetical protein
MDHHGMLLLSMLYQLVRCLLGLTAVLVRRDGTVNLVVCLVAGRIARLLAVR